MRTHFRDFLAVALLLTACGSSDVGIGPSTDGTVSVTTSTGGSPPDPDGYRLTVDGGVTVTLATSGTAEITVPAGRHMLELLGVAAQCSALPATPLEVVVPPRGSAPVGFQITCGLVSVRVTVATAGLDPDPDGYRILVDGIHLASVAANGTVNVRLDPGNRTIALASLAPNCTADGADSRTVSVVAGGEIPTAEFSVVCTATTGAIAIVISSDRPGLVHEAALDGGAPAAVGQGERSYLEGVLPGDHVVSLTPSASCSVHTAELPVTVTAGALTRDTAEVTFVVTCTAPPASARIAFVRSRLSATGPVSPYIYLANSDGTGAGPLTSGSAPAWSPDGRSIAFNRGDGVGDIYIIRADGSGEKRVAAGGRDPAWSPDGQRIVFSTGSAISSIDVRDLRVTQLLSSDFRGNPRDYVSWPAWRSDGRISFVWAPDYDSYEPWQIYLMEADGSAPRDLNITRNFAEVHAWSPDGSRIALGAFEGNRWTIASLDSSGADFRTHYRADSHGYAGNPDWSPDGRELAFNAYVIMSGCRIPACPMRIFAVSTDGGPARRLIPEVQGPAYWDDQPAWSLAGP